MSQTTRSAAIRRRRFVRSAAAIAGVAATGAHVAPAVA
jgi:hypothetical protein